MPRKPSKKKAPDAMGTNYYWKKGNAVALFLDTSEGKHIGKASAGWCFQLHVYPKEGINDLSDWQAIWDAGGGEIRDEYGLVHKPGTMVDVITKRGWPPRAEPPHGYRSKDEFLRDNFAQDGPNGLMRSLMGLRTHCIGHGEGTWDLIDWEFS